ncbi:hypothetical protein NL404_19225, partial [Klebsiella pneumoniae]|nr:hypothetical protein [Klebsiella pneumoniae]
TVCVVGKMRDLILQLSKSSIYSTKPTNRSKSLPGLGDFCYCQCTFLSSMGSDAKKGKYEKYVLFITKN